MEKRKPSYTVGKANCCTATFENSMEVPQNLKIELSYDPAIPLLNIHPEKMKTPIQKDICTSVFTALSFTIAKM